VPRLKPGNSRILSSSNIKLTNMFGGISRKERPLKYVGYYELEHFILKCVYFTARGILIGHCMNMKTVGNQEITISFIHTYSAVTEWCALHCTVHRILPNATQTRNVSTLNAQDTAFKHSDTSGRGLFAVTKHQWNTSAANPYCLVTIIKWSSEIQVAL
jgi:hypothetical protein